NPLAQRSLELHIPVAPTQAADARVPLRVAVRFQRPAHVDVAVADLVAEVAKAESIVRPGVAVGVAGLQAFAAAFNAAYPWYRLALGDPGDDSAGVGVGERTLWVVRADVLMPEVQHVP